MADHDEGLDRRQRLLLEARDKLCGGNSAELARQIGKDPTYVNRLFYPEGKAGRKGIGLEIMAVASRELYLPAGFWDREPPALTDENVEVSKFMRELRNAVAHGKVGDDERRLFMEWDSAVQQNLDRIRQRIADAKNSREMHVNRLGRIDKRIEHLTGEAPAAAEPRAAYGMEPILAWEHPEDLPEGEFVMIPRLDVHLSAGGGREQVEIDLVKENPQAFRSEWIRLMKLKPAKLAAMRAAGESMEPTIHDGDSLLVDTSQATVVDGKVYALWYDGGERVKRLFRLPGGGLRIVSDNPRFPTVEVQPSELEHVRVIGRIVHRSGTGGL